MKSKEQTSPAKCALFFYFLLFLANGKNCIQWFMFSVAKTYSQMQICAMKCAGFPFRILFCVRRGIEIIISHIFLCVNPISLSFLSSFPLFIHFIIFFSLLPAVSFLPFDSMSVQSFYRCFFTMCTKTYIHNFIILHYIHMKSNTVKLLMKTGQNPIEKCTAKGTNKHDKDMA